MNKILTLSLLTISTLCGCSHKVAMSHETASSGLKVSGVSISAANSVNFSAAEQAALKNELEASLKQHGLLDAQSGQLLNLKIEKLAFRAGGTTQTLRQLGGRDSVRSEISLNGSQKESVVAHLRAEGFENLSATKRKEQLTKLLAQNVVHAIR